ncbi:hypothetical protein Slin15195_G118860 [Septoria linicola]|uniref:Uncharacterized protein n=1 Tax=Septoria linicola TaxID=215465 RepID=A0A9Q9AYX6_9PEZI|nr:hypothetical protein Slin15195_G118860 [Septoria linicola]
MFETFPFAHDKAAWHDYESPLNTASVKKPNDRSRASTTRQARSRTSAQQYPSPAQALAAITKSNRKRPRREKYVVPWERDKIDSPSLTMADTPGRKPPPRSTIRYAGRAPDSIIREQARRDQEARTIATYQALGPAMMTGSESAIGFIGETPRLDIRSSNMPPPSSSLIPAYANVAANGRLLSIAGPLYDPFDSPRHLVQQNQLGHLALPSRTSPFEQIPHVSMTPPSRASSRTPRVASAPGPQSAPHAPLSVPPPKSASGRTDRSPSADNVARTVSTKLEHKITCAIHARLLINPDTFGAELMRTLSFVCRNSEKASFLISSFPVAEGQRLGAMNEHQVRVESQLCLGQASGLVSLMYELTSGGSVIAQIQSSLYDLYLRMCEHDARARSEHDLLRLQEHLAQVVEEDQDKEGAGATDANGVPSPRAEAAGEGVKLPS